MVKLFTVNETELQNCINILFAHKVYDQLLKICFQLIGRKC